MLIEEADARDLGNVHGLNRHIVGGQPVRQITALQAGNRATVRVAESDCSPHRDQPHNPLLDVARHDASWYHLDTNYGMVQVPMSAGSDRRPTRVEGDFLGDVEVPADALYGAQTARAVTNFRVSGATLG